MRRFADSNVSEPVSMTRELRAILEVKMNDKPVMSAAKSKPCVCHLFTRTKLVWRPTGRQNPQNESEYQCKVCGATAWH